MIIDIKDTLNRLVHRNEICSHAVPGVLASYGCRRKVTPSILRRAVQGYGVSRFIQFFKEALDFPESLKKFLLRKHGSILWGAKFRHLLWSSRVDIAQEMVVLAILAYIEEIEK